MADTTLNWKRTKKQLIQAVDGSRLVEAIGLLRQLAYMLGRTDYIPEIEAIDTTYTAMRRFAIDGGDDPERTKNFNDLGEKICFIADSITRAHRAANSDTEYFRAEKSSASRDLVSLAHSYVEAQGDDSRFAIIDDIFSRVWTSFPLSPIESEALEEIVAIDRVGASVVVSALLLALLEYYDVEKISLLAKMYLSGDEYVAARALTAIVIALSLNRGRANRSASVDNAISAMCDVAPSLPREIESVCRNFIRALGTEKVTEKVTGEIFPDIMKLGPQLRQKFKDMDIKDMGDLEDNPEWMDMLDESGLSDRLRQLSEIQEQGGDVMMATFSKMKSFPFFRTLVNWFVPFSPDNPAISADGLSRTFAETVNDNPMLCDSDKYSMMFMIANFSQAHRNLVEEQINQQSIHLREEAAASLSPGRVEQISKESANYLQNLYRFFKLYPHVETTPIFDTSVDFLAVDVFNRLLSSDDAVMRLSDAFMAVAKYDAALSILRKVGDSSRDATFYQKQGYCCVNCHEYESAIESFNNAHGLNPKNKWTLRQLALCYRAVGKPSEAARCYAKLSELMPENAKIARRLAECQEECSDYSEAAKALYKVIFYDEGSAEARVALSRCLLHLGDVEKAGRYADEALRIDSSPATLCQKAAVLIAEKKLAEAVGRLVEANDDAFHDTVLSLVPRYIDERTAVMIIDEVTHRQINGL